MSIFQLKMQARQALAHNKLNMIYVCLVIGLFNLIPSIASESSISALSIIFMILLVATVHGYVTSSLKIITGQGDQVSEKADGLVFIHRFKELFPTYLIKTILVYLPLIIAAIIACLIPQIGWLTIFRLIKNPATIQSLDLMNVLSLFFIVVFIAGIASVYIDIRLSMTGYLIETHHLRNFAACKMSWQIMKGYCWTYFKLMFSYIGWIFLGYIVESLVYSLLPGTAGSILSLVVLTLYQAYVYLPEQNVAIATLYMIILNNRNMNQANL